MKRITSGTENDDLWHICGEGAERREVYGKDQNRAYISADGSMGRGMPIISILSSCP